MSDIQNKITARLDKVSGAIEDGELEEARIQILIALNTMLVEYRKIKKQLQKQRKQK